MNILIIDDDKDYLADVLMMLGDEYNCFTATSAKKGLRIFKNEIIDLVLLDIYIGNEYEGLELLETFKKLDALVPIIMITNYDDVSTVVKAMKMEAYDYFDKKFEFMKYLFDTNIIVEHLKGKKSIEVSFLRKGSAVSIVTRAELFYGAYRSKRSQENLSKIREMLAELGIETAPLTEEIIDKYSKEDRVMIKGNKRRDRADKHKCPRNT